ncbi:MAG: hypothetical protein KDA58_14000 [Planctomycetaceae bacterium]|nr:hypothetical protein [Planctomycetaceae bacterium]
MLWTHELGHVLGGCCCGGKLQALDLRPWSLPYSLFAPDPHPLVTLWCGPLLGAVVPLGLALVIRRDWAWLIAHFCLLANGLYLALGAVSGDRYLDTTQLLEHGASPLAIAAYCIPTIAWGYWGLREAIRQRFAQPVSSSIEQPTQVASDGGGVDASAAASVPGGN